MPDTDKNVLYLSMEVFLTIALSKESALLAAVYEKWHSHFNEKQIRFIFTGNELLRCIDHSEWLHSYPGIVSSLLSGNYPKTTGLVFEALDVEEDLPVALVDVLDQTLLYTASISLDSEMYLYAKKVQALVALEKGDRESYGSIMAELDQLS